MNSKSIHWMAALCLALGCAARSPAQGAAERPAAGSEKTMKITFDDMEAGKPSAGFSIGRTGKGADGTWVVRDASDGKGKVLAQTSADDTDYRFPVAVLDSTSAKDVTVSVRFRAVSGKVDQAGGIVFRYADPNDYYVVRANALEDNCRIYHVVSGKRVQFGGKDVGDHSCASSIAWPFGSRTTQPQVKPSAGAASVTLPGETSAPVPAIRRDAVAASRTARRICQ